MDGKTCSTCHLVMSGDLLPLQLTCGHVTCNECASAMAACSPPICIICSQPLCESGGAVLTESAESTDAVLKKLQHALQQQTAESALVPDLRTAFLTLAAECLREFQQNANTVVKSVEQNESKWLDQSTTLHLQIQGQIEHELAAVQQQLDTLEYYSDAELDDVLKYANLPVPCYPMPYFEIHDAKIERLIEETALRTHTLVGGKVECLGYGTVGHAPCVLNYQDNVIDVKCTVLDGTAADWLTSEHLTVSFDPSIGQVDAIQTCGDGAFRIYFSIGQVRPTVTMTVTAADLSAKPFTSLSGSYIGRYARQLSGPFFTFATRKLVVSPCNTMFAILREKLPGAFGTLNSNGTLSSVIALVKKTQDVCFTPHGTLLALLPKRNEIEELWLDGTARTFCLASAETIPMAGLAANKDVIVAIDASGCLLNVIQYASGECQTRQSTYRPYHGRGVCVLPDSSAFIGSDFRYGGLQIYKKMLVGYDKTQSFMPQTWLLRKKPKEEYHVCCISRHGHVLTYQSRDTVVQMFSSNDGQLLRSWHSPVIVNPIFMACSNTHVYILSENAVHVFC